MTTDAPLVLGIDTSCDDTAAAVLRAPRTILANEVASQFDLHAAFGGVVPEIASRAHAERITAVIDRALLEAGHSLDDLDVVAVTHRPGPVSYTHLTLPTTLCMCRSRWSPYH